MNLTHYVFVNMATNRKITKMDPMVNFQNTVHRFLYGPKFEQAENDVESDEEEELFDRFDDGQQNKHEDRDFLAHYPAGNLMRLLYLTYFYLTATESAFPAELFQNKSGVHFPIPEYMHRGHCRLNVTKDLMQTAVNAFAILLEGSVDDVLKLPAEYVLISARTIAMMKIAREKLAATWRVIKGDRKTVDIPYQTLELYRPLFKYLNGREMSRLNLSDTRILTFIGTHADLDRHQMGVVASKYMQVNPHWSNPKYLNLMNNLLCGVPVAFMRTIGSSVYLQLTNQAFGKSYSWSARDVSRLGLLLAEVDGPALGAIKPEAMSGITAQVMLQIPAESLQYITEMQLRYIGPKPLNILAKKLKAYQGQLRLFNGDLATKHDLILYYTLAVVLSALL